MPQPRVALVTDADRGIGRASALLLAERGVRVLACGEDQAAMADLPRETMMGGMIEVHPERLSKSEACQRALERARELFGPVYAVVSATDDGRFGPVEETPEVVQRELMESNFYRPMRLFQAAAPILREQGRGRLICVTSAAGRLAMPMSGAYSASQYAIEGLCDALRFELSVFGIAVILVEPGFVRESVVTPAQRRPLREIFGIKEGSPYLRLVNALEAALDVQMSRASTPPDVAEIIHRALVASRPKPRYAVTRRGAALLWARKMLPERFLDRRLAKRLGLAEIEDQG